jgi:hypothetical protein
VHLNGGRDPRKRRTNGCQLPHKIPIDWILLLNSNRFREWGDILPIYQRVGFAQEREVPRGKVTAVFKLAGEFAPRVERLFNQPN